MNNKDYSKTSMFAAFLQDSIITPLELIIDDDGDLYVTDPETDDKILEIVENVRNIKNFLKSWVE